MLSVMITCLLHSHPRFDMCVLVFYKMFCGTVMVFTSPSLSVFRFRCTLKFCVFLLTSNKDAELGLLLTQNLCWWNSLLMSPGVSAPAVLVLQNKAIFWGFTPSICNASCLRIRTLKDTVLACLSVKSLQRVCMFSKGLFNVFVKSCFCLIHFLPQCGLVLF